jgi:DNA-directed RNA polymerase subunit RPC12/RpoP
MMQTVNFNCSSCAKTMAVGLNLLGRNVRCPHCKQVIQAPASSAILSAGVQQTPTRDSKSLGHDGMLERPQSDAPTLPEPIASTTDAPADHAVGANDFDNPFAMNNDAAVGQGSWAKASQSESEPEIASPAPAAKSGGGPLIWMLLAYGAIVTIIAAYLFYERTQQAVGP